MKRKSSIIKLSILGVVFIIGILLSVCSFRLPFSLPIGDGLDTYKSFASSIKLGIDLKGGVYAIYDVADSNENTDNLDVRLEGTKKRLQDMIVAKGYSEATVVREGATRLRVEVPDVADPKAIFDIIGKPAGIVFILDETSTEVINGADHVTKATSVYSDGKPAVSLELNSVGADLFAKATADNIGKSMSMYLILDGKREEQPISTANINEAIPGGKAIISGTFTEPQTKELADQIMSGTFDVQLSLKESETISATLGSDALKWGIIAGAIGLLLVMVFLCVFYRGLGMVASISLCFYTILLLFFLAVLPWVQLTLPGIAGIILSLGMAVDANVVIYERIKDEYRSGKSISASVNAGFKKATTAILDSNITTIIAGVVLLILGTGSIKGFALTLLIGIVLSLFTALLLTRKLLKYIVTLNNTNDKFYNLRRNDRSFDIDFNRTTNIVPQDLKTGGLTNETK